ncbi:MAG: TVP38/TMEM64 family protein [Campylobacteraceae bacterium]|nr:TVP38/TMEM64 family protein [Campylobacteraceae bacterium]
MVKPCTKILAGVAFLVSVSAFVWNIDTNIFDWISFHASSFEDFLVDHPALGSLFFIGIYILVLGVGLPLASFLNVLTGYFFGGYSGAIVAFFGLSISASLTYWLGRTYVYLWLHKRYAEQLKRIKKELDRNGVFYVLAVRISGILPFFWVNIFFGASGLRWKHYILPTVLGMIPGVFLSMFVGTKLASLDTLRGVLEPSMAISLLFFGLFIFLFIWIKHFKKHKQA